MRSKIFRGSGSKRAGPAGCSVNAQLGFLRVGLRPDAVRAIGGRERPELRACVSLGNLQSLRDYEAIRRSVVAVGADIGDEDDLGPDVVNVTPTLTARQPVVFAIRSEGGARPIVVCRAGGPCDLDEAPRWCAQPQRAIGARGHGAHFRRKTGDSAFVTPAAVFKA